MLSLIRSTCRHSTLIKHNIAVRILSSSTQARYGSDSLKPNLGLGGLGSLSVPISVGGRSEIQLGNNSQSEKTSIPPSPFKPTSAGSTATGRRRGPGYQARRARYRKGLARRRAEAGESSLKSKDNDKKVKISVDGKPRDVGSEITAEVSSRVEVHTPADEIAPEEIEEIVRREPSSVDASHPSGDILASGRIQAVQVNIEEVTPMREMKVAKLAHGLHRVLFSPGVHPFRDLRSGVWNFPSSFHSIPTPEEYAFDRSPKYITPSQDQELLSLAKREKCDFIGSTSTLTGAFSHLYFAISGGKGVDLSSFSQSFASERSDFTSGAEIPACLILGPLGNGQYYVDSDKSFDTENILSEYGVILEKLLVTDQHNFKRFLNSSPPESVSEAERNEKEAYRYSKFGNLMMRSQLDCQDDRLPGSGVFDIKTRACLPIRHDRANHLENSQYSILKDKGAKLSFEKEYYDIVRAGMLKWSMQARIGGMDGIFVAYHNCRRLFGFQYLPMAEIDERLFGSSEMGQQAFNLVVSLFEALIQHCAEAFPGKEVSVVIRKAPTPDSRAIMAYVTPTGRGEKDEHKEQPIQAFTMSLTSYLNGRRIRRLLDTEYDPAQPQEWSVEYSITKSKMDHSSQSTARQALKKAIKEVKGISSVSVPTGRTIEEMSTLVPGIRWKNPDKRIMDLREEAKKSAGVYERLKRGWEEAVAWTKP